MWQLDIRPEYLSKWCSWFNNIKILVKIQWRIQSHFALFSLLLHMSIVLTMINTFSAILFNAHIGWINPRTYGLSVTSYSSGVPGSTMPLFGTLSDRLSPFQSSSISFESSRSPAERRQILVSEICSGTLSSLHVAEWQSIVLIRQTLITWVHPTWRSVAHTTGVKGELSDTSNEAIAYCWKFDQDAWMSSSISGRYPMVAFCFFWVQDSFCVVPRFWLPCYISNKSWTLAILCIFLAPTSIFISSMGSPDLSVSKCIFKLTQSRSSSASLSSLNRSLQVHIQTHSVTASMYFFTESWRVYRNSG